MVVYLNNCRGFDHADVYGTGAFYDLYSAGNKHSDKANNICVGQECIVASKTKDNNIVFSWYKFIREDSMIDEENKSVRVFFGDFIKSDNYSKRDAAKSALYSPFFDKNGNFKRQSVIEH